MRCAYRILGIGGGGDFFFLSQRMDWGRTITKSQTVYNAAFPRFPNFGRLGAAFQHVFLRHLKQAGSAKIHRVQDRVVLALSRTPHFFPFPIETRRRKSIEFIHLVNVRSGGILFQATQADDEKLRKLRAASSNNSSGDRCRPVPNAPRFPIPMENGGGCLKYPVRVK